jgi:hypothetical protein
VPSRRRGERGQLLKKIFGRKDGDPSQQYTIDDLIVLERYAEAEHRIHEELRFRPNDLNLHLKLADVYVGLRSVQKAVEEYLWVADRYSADGFHDRAIAVLTKARRLNPMDDTLPQRIERLEVARKLEHSRSGAMEGFLRGLHTQEAGGSGTAVMEFQTIWRSLQKTRLLRELSGDQLKLLFQGVVAVYLNPGQSLVERGSREEALYVLVVGELSASFVDRVGATVDIRSFGPGQVIGESSLFEHKPWPANFKAKSKATLLKLTQAGLQICLTGNPDPRGFLDVMRREGNDREVLDKVTKLEGHA